MAISAATRLEIYNGALTEYLGQRKLATGEVNETSRVLDDAWNNGNFVIECLEESDWTNATRTMQIENDPSIEPSFGFPNVFAKPDDWVRTVALSTDQNFRTRLDEETGYADENGYWFTWPETLYVQFISKDDAYGLDTSKWTEYFKTFMKTRLARKTCLRLTQSSTRHEELLRDENRALLNARGKNGMNKPAVRMSNGRWNRARTTSLLRRGGY